MGTVAAAHRAGVSVPFNVLSERLHVLPAHLHPFVNGSHLWHADSERGTSGLRVTQVFRK